MSAIDSSKQPRPGLDINSGGGEDDIGVYSDRPIEFRRNSKNPDSKMQKQEQSLGYRRSSSGQKVVYGK